MGQTKARCLRTFVRVARCDHGICQQCQKPIHAGEEYEGWVMVYDRRLWVTKIHRVCEFDDPEPHQTRRTQVRPRSLPRSRAA